MRNKSPLQLFRLERSLSRNELSSFADFESRERTALSLAIARCESGLEDPDDNVCLKFLWAVLKKKGFSHIKEAQQNWYESQQGN